MDPYNIVPNLTKFNLSTEICGNNFYATSHQVVEPIFRQNFEDNPERDMAVLKNVNKVAKRETKILKMKTDHL